MANPTPELKNRCLSCNKLFSTSSHLLRHAATHTGQRRRECPFCGKTFSRVDVVRRHIRTCAPADERNVVLPTAKRGKKRSACEACRQMKMSCDTGSPCSRCAQQGRSCSYKHLAAQSAGNPQSCLEEPDAAHRSVSRSFAGPKYLLRFTDPTNANNSEAVMEDSFAKGELQEPEGSLAAHLRWEPENLTAGFHPSEQWSFDILDFWLDADGQYKHPTCGDGMDLRVGEMVSELAKTHQAMSKQEGFDWKLAANVFTVDNLRTFVGQYFRYVHPYNPVMHPSSFNYDTTQTHLLLAIFLFGSAFSAPDDSAIAATSFFDIAEQYIFGHAIFTLGIRENAQGDRQKVISRVEIDILQAAQIIHTLQGARNHCETRRRIRVFRHPQLVAAVRQYGLLRFKRDRQICNPDEYLREECILRLATWTFILDVYLAAFLNNAPHIAPFELTCDLPDLDQPLTIDASHDADPLPRTNDERCQHLSLSDIVSSLFQDCWPGPHDPMYGSLSSLHVLVTAFGLLSTATTVRKTGLTNIAGETILRATDRWKDIWDVVAGKEGIEPSRREGFIIPITELLWLTRMIIGAACSGDTSCLYMQNIATDSLRELNDFVHMHKHKDL